MVIQNYYYAIWMAEAGQKEEGSGSYSWLTAYIRVMNTELLVNVLLLCNPVICNFDMVQTCFFVLLICQLIVSRALNDMAQSRNSMHAMVSVLFDLEIVFSHFKQIFIPFFALTLTMRQFYSLSFLFLLLPVLVPQLICVQLITPLFYSCSPHVIVFSHHSLCIRTHWFLLFSASSL